MPRGFLYRCLALLVVLLLGVSTPCKGQEIVNRMLGTDFWMMFLKNSEESFEIGLDIDCFFVLTATEESSVIISNSGGWDTMVIVPADGVLRVSVPDDQSPTYHFGALIENRGWHIQSTTPISVTAHNHVIAGHDATTIMPTDALSCDHMAMVYQTTPNGPQVGIVAPYDNTNVQIVFDKNLCSLDSVIYNAGDTLELQLMSGQTCLLRNAGLNSSLVPWVTGDVDLTGTRIRSSKPVAVFQGNNASYVPRSSGAASDHLYDQCKPIEYWGTHFVFNPVIKRQRRRLDYPPVTYYNYGDIVRVLALEDGCRVSLDGQEVTTLQSGGFYDFVFSDQYSSLPLGYNMDFHQSHCVEITATSPVMVGYFITGNHFGGHPGDPAFMTIPPIENGVDHAIFHPYNTRLVTQHWMNIVTPTLYASQITLDGENISSQFFSTANGYSYTRIPVSDTTHTLDAADGHFIAWLYGLGDQESYLHAVALNTINKAYNVWTQRYEVCVGDTVMVGIIKYDNSLSSIWYIDGELAGLAQDTMLIAFDSVGTHQITTVITPIGDTVYTYITVGQYATSHSVETICSGGSYDWRGLTLTMEGIYYDTLSRMEACDTILALHLNVTPPPVTTAYDTLCQGSTYIWRGRRLNEEGVYADTLSNADGCDSIVTLELSTLITPQISFSIDEDCNSKKYTIMATMEPSDDISPFWSSLPTDSTLAGQRWDSIVVSPSAATLYTLAFEGRCPNDTSILLTPSEWPVAAMEVHPPMLDLDNLQLVAQDVSLNATERTWYVDDALA
ncbi:MAG: IgGFc-binding protein, partial [Bacteroidales bacterium]|nr:IgGFc-binding protein [Bacteroidales bacterium]